MFKKLNAESLIASNLCSFRCQESIFAVLNLFLFAVLFLLHTSFSNFWHRPPLALVVFLGIGFLLKTFQLVWIQNQSQPSTPTAIAWRTWASIGLNVILAIVLTALTDHEDSPYFVLLVVPILEAAFELNLMAVVGVISVASFLNFYWVWAYFRRHPPLEVSEYFEAGTDSLLFALVGVLVWLLLQNLRQQGTRLANNVLELESAREKLVQEEKLAAIGRLSSAIAHEIRNPVAMIASSLATAKQLNGREQEEMFGIAREEAARLVNLTTEFLDYARPHSPKLTSISLTETLAYVADVCRAHAIQRGVQMSLDVPAQLFVEADAGLLQQAVINLVMNAVEASPAGDIVKLSVSQQGRGICLKVENSGPAIPEEELAHIFEPFFTTKPHGTGLGLAIARNIAHAHGGDLRLIANHASQVCFAINLPMPNGRKDGA